MTLKIQYYKKAVLVTGAFDVKDELKSLGGEYVHTLQGWVFSKKRRDAVISRLQSLQGVDVVDETADTAATDRSTASASANANANSGGAMSSSARGARSSASKKKQVRKTDAIKQHTRRRKLEREKKCRRCKTKKKLSMFFQRERVCKDCCKYEDVKMCDMCKTWKKRHSFKKEQWDQFPRICEYCSSFLAPRKQPMVCRQPQRYM